MRHRGLALHLTRLNSGGNRIGYEGNRWQNNLRE
nr:MAG TPA: hypothetical protein [Caudoviricetes sp.]